VPTLGPKLPVRQARWAPRVWPNRWKKRPPNGAKNSCILNSALFLIRAPPFVPFSAVRLSGSRCPLIMAAHRRAVQDERQSAGRLREKKSFGETISSHSSLSLYARLARPKRLFLGRPLSEWAKEKQKQMNPALCFNPNQNYNNTAATPKCNPSERSLSLSLSAPGPLLPRCQFVKGKHVALCSGHEPGQLVCKFANASLARPTRKESSPRNRASLPLRKRATIFPFSLTTRASQAPQIPCLFQLPVGATNWQPICRPMAASVCRPAPMCHNEIFKRLPTHSLTRLALFSTSHCRWPDGGGSGGLFRGASLLAPRQSCAAERLSDGKATARRRRVDLLAKKGTRSQC